MKTNRMSGLAALLVLGVLAVSCRAHVSKTDTGHPALPRGLTMEEYELMGPPSGVPLTFEPVKGTYARIMAKRATVRVDIFPDISDTIDYLYAMKVKTETGDLIAQVTPPPVGSGGELGVAVSLGKSRLYSIPTGDNLHLKPLQGLWSVSGHWFLEVIHADLTWVSNDVVNVEQYGQIIEDGELLNDRYGYQEAFGFQTIDGKPFYFFKRDDRIGISFDGQEVPLGYDTVPHYDAGVVNHRANPVKAHQMVAFFAEKGGTWYYVEIGDYK